MKTEKESTLFHLIDLNDELTKFTNQNWNFFNG